MRVRNFVMFFMGKEGTTPVVHLLDMFERVSVVHQADGHGWEPFDRHNCGEMPLRRLDRCLRLLWENQPVDMEALNRLYTKTAQQPLASPASGTAVGFKMRFRPPNRSPLGVSAAGRGQRVRRALHAAQRSAYRRRLFATLAELDVTAFVVVRQDILRWALSDYHGDGTGQRGHMQFALARGQITRDEIGTIRVDLDRLHTLLERCRRRHEGKRELVAGLHAAGVHTTVLRYEDFLADRGAYLTGVLEAIDVEPRAGEVEDVLRRGTDFQKVHSENLADFVENHREVLDAFGEPWVAW